MHKAIGQSGARLYTMATLAGSENGQLAHMIAANMQQASWGSGNARFSGLRALPAGHDRAVRGITSVDAGYGGSTVVDGAFCRNSRAKFTHRRAARYPVMLGSNADEMTTLLDVFLAGGEDIPTAELLKAQINLLGEQANSFCLSMRIMRRTRLIVPQLRRF